MRCLLQISRIVHAARLRGGNRTTRNTTNHNLMNLRLCNFALPPCGGAAASHGLVITHMQSLQRPFCLLGPSTHKDRLRRDAFALGPERLVILVVASGSRLPACIGKPPAQIVTTAEACENLAPSSQDAAGALWPARALALGAGQADTDSTTVAIRQQLRVVPERSSSA